MSDADELQRGLAALAAGRHAEAFAILRPFAEAGHADVQARLGSLVAHGLHRFADTAAHDAWVISATEQERAAAREQQRRDTEQAARWLQAAAEQGSAAAAHDLATLYAGGFGGGTAGERQPPQPGPEPAPRQAARSWAWAWALAGMFAGLVLVSALGTAAGRLGRMLVGALGVAAAGFSCPWIVVIASAFSARGDVQDYLKRHERPIVRLLWWLSGIGGVGGLGVGAVLGAQGERLEDWVLGFGVVGGTALGAVAGWWAYRRRNRPG
jgi:hypothetical protein